MTQNKTVVTAEPGRQELFIKREFNAQRENVFRAFTDANLIVQWIGPKNMKTDIEKYDSRPGGSYRFINTDAQNNEFIFNGVMHDVNYPETIIRTFEFEGMRGHVCLETVTFKALPDQRTSVMIQSIFQSIADRDGIINAGMERGLNDGFDKLDSILARE